MRLRRLAALAVLALLLLAAGAAAWRSVRPQPETPATVAASLLCPSCQGETVAQSQSPMAAAMRDTIAEQLAAGRTGAQVRQWFVERYGPAVLAEPPPGGLGVVLWVVPGCVAAAALAFAIRARRRRAAPAARVTARTHPGEPRDGGRPAAAHGAGRVTARAHPGELREERFTARARPGGGGRRASRAWDAAAVGVVGLVAAVALASPSHRPQETPARPVADRAATLVTLARSLEDKGRYAEAAQIYRDALRERPDDRTTLRLAFTLLRSQRPAEAEKAVRRVLGNAPDDPNAVLLLGLAQRGQGSPAATATLRRFLTLAPDAPAAAEVRRMLRAD
ncbi:cytochrome c-type biogenesis protein CcmH [Rhizomonospora bruguierae]|uniref:cytochrome c-type biogenesis protein CcmH n=1 Tax=Rhizomonospora bruguierae TaxID=1581705 RepID=UPI001BCB61EB|nr:cytochrome c-type biogenesis protein CcmH [Micromonospora sp. NBRC 107566]